MDTAKPLRKRRSGPGSRLTRLQGLWIVLFVDQGQLFVKLFAVNLQQSQEQGGYHRADDETHHAEQSDAAEHREKHQQLVHTGLMSDDDRFEQVVDKANDKRGDYKERDCLPNLPTKHQA